MITCVQKNIGIVSFFVAFMAKNSRPLLRLFVGWPKLQTFKIEFVRCFALLNMFQLYVKSVVNWIDKNGKKGEFITSANPQ